MRRQNGRNPVKGPLHTLVDLGINLDAYQRFTSFIGSTVKHIVSSVSKHRYKLLSQYDAYFMSEAFLFALPNNQSNLHITGFYSISMPLRSSFFYYFWLVNFSSLLHPVEFLSYNLYMKPSAAGMKAINEIFKQILMPFAMPHSP